jgi:hypothetical protein
MNGYVSGNNAYKYEDNVIVLDRNERWQAHRNARLEVQAAEHRAMMVRRQQKEAAHNRRMKIAVLVLQFATAVLLLAPVCAASLEALTVLWNEGIADHLSQLMLAAAGAALTVVISAEVCRRSERLLNDIMPEEEDEAAEWG